MQSLKVLGDLRLGSNFLWISRRKLLRKDLLLVEVLRWGSLLWLNCQNLNRRLEEDLKWASKILNKNPNLVMDSKWVSLKQLCLRNLHHHSEEDLKWESKILHLHLVVVLRWVNNPKHLLKFLNPLRKDFKQTIQLEVHQISLKLSTPQHYYSTAAIVMW